MVASNFEVVTLAGTFAQLPREMSIVTPPLGTATVESLKVLVRVRPDGSSTSTDNIVVIDEVNNGIISNKFLHLTKPCFYTPNRILFLFAAYASI